MTSPMPMVNQMLLLRVARQTAVKKWASRVTSEIFPLKLHENFMSSPNISLITRFAMICGFARTGANERLEATHSREIVRRSGCR
jgi:hypothetical protein